MNFLFSILSILFFILLIPIILGGKIIRFFFPRENRNNNRKNQEKSYNNKKSTKDTIEEINLHRFDKDQGEYVDFEEKKDNKTSI